MNFHMVGTHRRIKFQDVNEYKNKILDKGKRARDELAKQAQELQLGYE